MLLEEERQKEKVSNRGTNQEGSSERLLLRPLELFTVLSALGKIQIFLALMMTTFSQHIYCLIAF